MADAVMMVWAGGEHAFRLRIGELRALDDATRDGAYQCMFRIRAMRYRVDDVLETVRLGLIGGGMDPQDAGQLVARVEREEGVGNLAPLATEIIWRGFHRREEVDPPGKTAAGDPERTPA